MRFRREHKHRADYSKTETFFKASLLTGVPVQLGHREFCRCGYAYPPRLSDAAYQQLAWGADEESFWDDGPIRLRPGAILPTLVRP